MDNKKSKIKNEKTESSSVEKTLGLKRTGKAHWEGNLKDGKGTVSSQTGAIDEVNYSYKARFEEGKKGTNPEELLATAHAGCFTMAVSDILTKKGFYSISLDTVATVFLVNSSITKIHLSITGSIKDITINEFSKIVKEAEKNCIISRTLSVPISSEFYLESV